MITIFQDISKKILFTLLHYLQNNFTKQKIEVAKIKKTQSASERANASEVSKALGYTSAICFLLSASFLIKLAIDVGWFIFTPEQQLIAASVLGIGLIVAGYTLKHLDIEYASILPAIGIVILYSVVYGGNIYYKIITSYQAVPLICLISIYSIYLLTTFNTVLFSIISTIGTYICPFLILSINIDITNVGIYFILWAVLYSGVSITTENRLIHLLASYFGIGSLALLNIFFSQKIEYLGFNAQFILAFVELTQFIIFSIGLFAYSTMNKSKLTQAESDSYLPILLFFYGIEYSLLLSTLGTTTPWIALLFPVFLIILKLVSDDLLKSNETCVNNLVYGFTAIVFAHAGYLELLPDKYSFIATVIIFTVFFKFHSILFKSIIISFISIIILIREYLLIATELFKETSIFYATYGSVFAILVFLTYFSMRNKSFSKNFHEYQMLILIIGHILSISVIYNITLHFSAVYVSLLWGLYSGSLLAISYKMRDYDLSTSCLLILILSVFKLSIYDVINTSPLTRVLCLFITGCSLYFAGFIFKKISKLPKN